MEQDKKREVTSYVYAAVFLLLGIAAIGVWLYNSQQKFKIEKEAIQIQGTEKKAVFGNVPASELLLSPSLSPAPTPVQATVIPEPPATPIPREIPTQTNRVTPPAISAVPTTDLRVEQQIATAKENMQKSLEGANYYLEEINKANDELAKVVNQTSQYLQEGGYGGDPILAGNMAKKREQTIQARIDALQSQRNSYLSKYQYWYQIYISLIK